MNVDQDRKKREEVKKDSQAVVTGDLKVKLRLRLKRQFVESYEMLDLSCPADRMRDKERLSKSIRK
jgi:hypothetical protein